MPIDRSKHVLYTQKAKKCIQKLLSRDYDRGTAAALWEKVQLKYAEFLEDEPALGGAKITVSIYDPILIFAWYAVVPDQPRIEDIQQDVYDCFMGSFDTMGKVFNLNRRLDNRLAARVFQKTSDMREKEFRRMPASFRMGSFSYDREDGVIRYCFTQCPNAEFAKRHHMESVLPVMCNCDHFAMQKLHATLIREGTCVTSNRCDYCIVGDKSPLAAEYQLVRNEAGLLLSVKRENR